MLVSIPVRVVIEWYPPVGAMALKFDAVFRRTSVGVYGIQRTLDDRVTVEKPKHRSHGVLKWAGCIT